MDEELFVSGQSESAGEHTDFFAEIATVYPDGVTLLIDGSETQKHYLVNADSNMEAGDKVKVLKTGGTYIVEYVVGSPNSGSDRAISKALEASY